MRIELLFSYAVALSAPCCFKIPHYLEVGTFFPLPDPDDSMRTVLITPFNEGNYKPYSISSEADIQTLRILEKMKFLPETMSNSDTCVPGELAELLNRSVYDEPVPKKFYYEGREKETGHPRFKMVKTKGKPSFNVIPIYLKNPCDDKKMRNQVCFCTCTYGCKICCTGITMYNSLVIPYSPYSPILCCIASSLCPVLTLTSLFEGNLIKKGTQGWIRILAFTCCGPGWLLDS